jgi:hypothetical protein
MQAWQDPRASQQAKRASAYLHLVHILLLCTQLPCLLMEFSFAQAQQFQKHEIS